MKVFKESDVIAWTYKGRRAVGVVKSSNREYAEIVVAVDYFMDSNVKDGGLWYADTVYYDIGGEPTLATKQEITRLLHALMRSEIALTKFYQDEVEECVKLKKENERLKDRNIIQRILNL